ncbi:MAG TPA: ATP-binding protein, partial [Polyangia bacterium]
MPRLRPWLTVLSGPAATLFAFAIQYALLPDPDIAPFVFFFFGVALAAWVGGRSAGLVAAALSALVGNYAFIHPHWGWSLSAPALVATGLFTVSSAAVALVCGALRSAVEQAQRSAEALRQSEELNRRVIESSPDCVKVLDLDGHMLSMSPGGQRLLEIDDLAAVLHASWAGFWQGADHAGALAALATARAGGTGRHHGFCPTAKGTPKWWDVLVTAMVGPDGRPERLLAISRDVTERERAEAALHEMNARLRETDRRKDEFLAMLSHELRNPLTPIRNSLFVLERAPAGGDQARRAQAVIDRQVDQLARLVDDLLDITRISRGKIRLQPERVDLVAIVQRTAEDHRSLFERAGIALELRLPAAPLWLTADPKRLAQVVGNLLQNAAKFTGAGGSTVVTVARPDEAAAALLTVRDTGVGIAPDMLPRLFEPFAQADRTLDRSGGGLGLGL